MLAEKEVGHCPSSQCCTFDADEYIRLTSPFGSANVRAAGTHADSDPRRGPLSKSPVGPIQASPHHCRGGRHRR
jgi:hypothetical protein